MSIRLTNNESINVNGTGTSMPKLTDAQEKIWKKYCEYHLNYKIIVYLDSVSKLKQKPIVLDGVLDSSKSNHLSIIDVTA